MKTAQYNKYGDSSNIQLIEIDKPITKDNEVLIKICASSINSADHRMLRANPFFIRFMQGIFKPKNKTLGIDIAGIVEAVGEAVTQFKPGDKVYGTSYINTLGAYAEYICLSENAPIVSKPINVSFEQAAAVPVAAMTAVQGLERLGLIQNGQKLLINGASGGVGSFAVLFAKALGAHVTGVCSTRNVNIIYELGADIVIDYMKEDFTAKDEKYDFIIDVVGNYDAKDYKKVLTNKGKCVVIGFSSMFKMIKLMVYEMTVSKKEEKKITGLGPAVSSKKYLNYIKELIEEGKVIPIIDRTYPLSEIAEAMQYFENEHARTKVVISMEQGD